MWMLLAFGARETGRSGTSGPRTRGWKKRRLHRWHCRHPDAMRWRRWPCLLLAFVAPVLTATDRGAAAVGRTTCATLGTAATALGLARTTLGTIRPNCAGRARWPGSAACVCCRAGRGIALRGRAVLLLRALCLQALQGLARLLLVTIQGLGHLFRRWGAGASDSRRAASAACCWTFSSACSGVNFSSSAIFWACAACSMRRMLSRSSRAWFSMACGLGVLAGTGLGGRRGIRCFIGLGLCAVDAFHQALHGFQAVDPAAHAVLRGGLGVGLDLRVVVALHRTRSGLLCRCDSATTPRRG